MCTTMKMIMIINNNLCSPDQFIIMFFKFCLGVTNDLIPGSVKI